MCIRDRVSDLPLETKTDLGITDLLIERLEILTPAGKPNIDHDPGSTLVAQPGYSRVQSRSPRRADHPHVHTPGRGTRAAVA
eukprot:8957268-Heterocapsa_arctica.AAC.1